MTNIVHYFKRSTIILLICLGMVIVVAVWSQQYLAIRGDAVTQQTSIANDGVSSVIVKELPVQALLNEQILTLQHAPKSVYTQQVAGHNIGVLVPNFPAVTATNTQLGNSTLISWYNRSELYDGIMIYRANDATTPGELIATLTVQQNGSYYDTTVSNGQTYYYSVQTFRNVTNAEPILSDLSPRYPVTVSDNIAPLPPQEVKVSVSKDDSTVLIVQWKNESTAEVAKNTIYRSTQAGVVGDEVAITSAEVTEWQDTTVESGTVYYYTVSASDEAGNESSITLPVAPHGNPTPFIASTPQAL